MRRECGHRVHLLILISLVPLRALVPAAFGDPASHGYLLKYDWRRLLIPTKLFLASPYLFLPGWLLWLSEFEVELSAPEVEVNGWHLMPLDGLFRHKPLLSLVLLLLGVTQLSLLDLLILNRGGSRQHHKIGVQAFVPWDLSVQIFLDTPIGVRVEIPSLVVICRYIRLVWPEGVVGIYEGLVFSIERHKPV